VTNKKKIKKGKYKKFKKLYELDECLNDSTVREEFKNFSKENGHEDEALFLEQVNEYKMTKSVTQRIEKQKLIYNLFIDPNSPHFLKRFTNSKHWVRQEQLIKIANGEPSVFLTLEKDVKNFFVQGHLFKQFKDSSEAAKNFLMNTGDLSSSATSTSSQSED
jgi:hypothetical protein